MARPKGYRLNRSALEDLLEIHKRSMAEFADSIGMPLTTLSSLATGGRRASMPTVRKVVGGFRCRAATLFPELDGFVERMPEEIAS